MLVVSKLRADRCPIRCAASSAVRPSSSRPRLSELARTSMTIKSHELRVCSSAVRPRSPAHSRCCGAISLSLCLHESRFADSRLNVRPPCSQRRSLPNTHLLDVPAGTLEGRCQANDFAVHLPRWVKAHFAVLLAFGRDSATGSTAPTAAEMKKALARKLLRTLIELLKLWLAMTN